MKTGDSIFIKATVLRVRGNRLDAQTASGQLIQTDLSNAMKEDKKATATEKPKSPEKKSDVRKEHKAELNAPENKSGK